MPVTDDLNAMLADVYAELGVEIIWITAQGDEWPLLALPLNVAPTSDTAGMMELRPVSVSANAVRILTADLENAGLMSADVISQGPVPKWKGAKINLAGVAREIVDRPTRMDGRALEWNVVLS